MREANTNTQQKLKETKITKAFLFLCILLFLLFAFFLIANIVTKLTSLNGEYKLAIFASAVGFFVGYSLIVNVSLGISVIVL